MTQCFLCSQNLFKALLSNDPRLFFAQSWKRPHAQRVGGSSVDSLFTPHPGRWHSTEFADKLVDTSCSFEGIRNSLI